MRRVLAFIPPHAASVSYVRFFQPFAYLGPFGYELSALPEGEIPLTRRGAHFFFEPSLLDGFDALAFPQALQIPHQEGIDPLALIADLCDLARNRGLKVIYAPDDALHLITPDNPAHDRIEAVMPLVKAVQARADAIFVTTWTLAEHFKPLGKPVFVLPNAVEPRRWRCRPKISGEWRVGWSGGSGHLLDLLLILPAIRLLQRRQPVQFWLYGIISHSVEEELRSINANFSCFSRATQIAAELFQEFAAQLQEIQYRHLPWGEMSDFFDQLPALDLDIGLAPLAGHPFTQCKSALKFYEYAISGSLTIASRVVPYIDEVNITAGNDPREWADLIEHFLRRPDERQAAFEAQRDFVLRERNIETLCVRWAEALDKTFGR